MPWYDMTLCTSTKQVYLWFRHGPEVSFKNDYGTRKEIGQYLDIFRRWGGEKFKVAVYYTTVLHHRTAPVYQWR